MRDAANTHSAALVHLHAAVVGVLLGVLQGCVLLRLQVVLSATAIVFLLATVAWLCGSVVGLLVPGRARESAWLLGALGAWELLSTTAQRHAYELSILPVLMVLVAAMGAYAGRFFRARAASFASSKRLFFVENTAFVGGLVLVPTMLVYSGDRAIDLLPRLLVVVVLISGLASSDTSSSEAAPVIDDDA